jgi:hypothetical protein
LWRIGPKERTYLAGNFNCLIDTQSLQSLKVKCSIVEITFRADVPVNTLPLTKHLPGHMIHHISSRHIARNTEPLRIKVSGSYKMCELKQGKRTV